MRMNLYDQTSFAISKQVTKKYSTSFYHATQMLSRKSRMAIHAVYGFVRLADEIVDTFHDANQAKLLDVFESDLHEALADGISLNPILHSFALVVSEYKIPMHLIDSFLLSMKQDLHKHSYDNEKDLDEYIYGSADVVGLMCLHIFVNGGNDLFETLEKYAQKLGSAFQKVNFLRDLQNDIGFLERRYFHNFSLETFNDEKKQVIITDIQSDFKEARKGIHFLPGRSKLAVYIAYIYYMQLVKKIQKTPSHVLLQQRIRVSDTRKVFLFFRAWLLYIFRLI